MPKGREQRLQFFIAMVLRCLFDSSANKTRRRCFLKTAFYGTTHPAEQFRNVFPYTFHSSPQKSVTLPVPLFISLLARFELK